VLGKLEQVGADGGANEGYRYQGGDPMERLHGHGVLAGHADQRD
jgi:hypothetical protein